LLFSFLGFPRESARKEKSKTICPGEGNCEVDVDVDVYKRVDVRYQYGGLCYASDVIEYD